MKCEYILFFPSEYTIHNFDNTINQFYANFFAVLTTSNETHKDFGRCLVTLTTVKKNPSIKQSIKSLPTATKIPYFAHFKITINAFEIMRLK